MTETNNTYPITPPPELVKQWLTERHHQYYCSATNHAIVQAAKWGADTELEACCEWMTNHFHGMKDWTAELRAARRPKPTSLKEQALHALLHIDQGQHNERCHIIRRALEALDD